MRLNQLIFSTVAILIISCAYSAGADPNVFAGNWVGKGTYILKGDLTQCSKMQLEFSVTASELTFVSGRRECDKHDEDFYQVTMEYRDGLLFFGGQKVGSYDGNKLEASFRAPDGGTFRNWRMFMRRDGDHLMYEESRTMDGQSTPMISFAGLMIFQ